MFTYKEVFDASVEYFDGDEFAAKVFVDKYALVDDNKNYLELTPDDMHKRLAKEFARIELKYPNPMSENEIYNLFKDFKYIVPQGSPMSAIGNDYKVQSAGNCFVVEPPADSYGGICKTDQELAQLMKRRCGVGVDISNIRPKGMPTKNAAGTTDGIAIFMERFSNTCREVAQGGRRGALMLSISVEHPEIETFITIKEDLKKVTGANISIRVTDRFMNAVKSNSDFTLRFPVESDNPKFTKIVKAKEIWDKMMHSAWKSAEPGILFWDTIINNSIPDLYSKDHSEFITTSTNPCGELPLGKDSCRLLVLNLSSFVKKSFTADAKFDYELFSKYTQKAQRLMDDLIDLELEIIDKIINKIKLDPESDEVKEVELNLWKVFRSSCANGRRTGLGTTGIGDCLAKLNIKYGSSESIKITDLIYKTLAVAAHTSSCVMAKERGAFPIFNYKTEKSHPYLNKIFDNCSTEIKKLWKTNGRRNIALTTVAPTGSLSTLTQTTSGIEPAFLLSYVRRKKINPSDVNAKVDFVDDLGDKWQEFTVYHHGVKEWMNVTGKTNIEESPYFGATSNEIDWEKSVDIQAAAQSYIDHSLSKTCVTKDTLIETDCGLMYLDEIFDIDSMKNNESIPNTKGIKVKNADGRFVEPSHFHNMGVQKIIKLELNNGLSIKVTPKEQFIILDDESGVEEWQYIENICPGDRVKLS